MSEGSLQIAVVGAGLAGISAAAGIAKAGHHVTIFERRSQAGGRTSSFRDPVSGVVVDNGQHVLLEGCVELLDFLAQNGLTGAIRWHESFHLRLPDREHRDGGATAVLEPSRWLPKSLQFAPALFGFRILTIRERLAAARILWRIRRPAESAIELESITFAAWLRRHGAPPRVVSRLMEPVIVSALNEQLDRVSASAAVWIFQQAFFQSRSNARMGVPTVPLAEFCSVSRLEARFPTRVRFEGSSTVERLVVDQSAIRGLVVHGATRGFDAVVLAAAPDATAALLKTSGLDGDKVYQQFANLKHSPIVSGHFFFDPDVTIPQGAVALVQRRAQWMFDRYHATQNEDERGHVVIVVSAAGDFAELPRERMEQALLEDLREALPGTRGREPRRTLLVTEWNATFSARPGVGHERPPFQSPVIDGLFFASDACATGWPATMEGAVRAGNAAAAAAVARSLRRGHTGATAARGH